MKKDDENSMKGVLASFAVKYNGDFDKIYSALKRKEIMALEDVESNISHLKINRIWAITLLCDEYPVHLKSASSPPFVIFNQGNERLLSSDFKKISFGKIDSNIMNNLEELTQVVVDLLSKYVLKKYCWVSTLSSETDLNICKIISKMNIPIIYAVPIETLKKNKIILDEKDLLASPFLINDFKNQNLERFANKLIDIKIIQSDFKKNLIETIFPIIQNNKLVN